MGRVSLNSDLVASASSYPALADWEALKTVVHSEDLDLVRAVAAGYDALRNAAQALRALPVAIFCGDTVLTGSADTERPAYAHARKHSDASGTERVEIGLSLPHRGLDGPIMERDRDGRSTPVTAEQAGAELSCYEASLVPSEQGGAYNVTVRVPEAIVIGEAAIQERMRELGFYPAMGSLTHGR